MVKDLGIYGKGRRNSYSIGTKILHKYSIQTITYEMHYAIFFQITSECISPYKLTSTMTKVIVYMPQCRIVSLWAFANFMHPIIALAIGILKFSGLRWHRRTWPSGHHA